MPFTNEEIQEIANKIKWKPDNTSYLILYITIFCLISIIIIILYLIILNKDINCKLKNINNEIKNSNFMNKVENASIKEGMQNLSTQSIRYLVSKSDNKTNNLSLAEKYTPNSIIFENQKENPLLSGALSGY
jgi:hypothetical protein